MINNKFLSRTTDYVDYFFAQIKLLTAGIHQGVRRLCQLHLRVGGAV